MSVGFEDVVFGFGQLRRQRILEIMRSLDVDPNVLPDGRVEAGRLERLVSDPTVSMDQIRRSAIIAATNGFTNKQIAEAHQATLPTTLSDPASFIDTSFDFEGEQDFGDPDMPGPVGTNFMEETINDLLMEDPLPEDEMEYTDPETGEPLNPEQMVNPPTEEALPEDQMGGESGELTDPQTSSENTGTVDPGATPEPEVIE